MIYLESNPKVPLNSLSTRFINQIENHLRLHELSKNHFPIFILRLIPFFVPKPSTASLQYIHEWVLNTLGCTASW